MQSWNRFGKYNAQKVKDDNITFDSKLEHKRYLELKILLRTKEISDLEIHPIFDLLVCGVKVAKYEADFGYTDEKTGKKVYEDSKGFENDLFKLKFKLMKAIYPDLDLRIIGKKGT
jgi:hypothetical protein